MNLQQLHDLCDGNSYFSRTDQEIYAALNAGSRTVYSWVSREFRGNFLKIDTTSVVLQPGQEQYAMPPDLRIMIRWGEQLQGTPAGAPYNWMSPVDINSEQFIDRQYDALVASLEGPRSDFVYAGPFLADADALGAAGPPGNIGDQIRSVLMSPIPKDTRVTKMYYVAQFVEIVGPGSFLMMPPESHDVIADLASAELVRKNGDLSLEGSFKTAGTQRFQEDFLPWMRMNQQGAQPYTQEPYIDDLS